MSRTRRPGDGWMPRARAYARTIVIVDVIVRLSVCLSIYLSVCLSIYDASTAIGIPTIYMVLVLYDI